jgi:hypothetical protein
MLHKLQSRASRTLRAVAILVSAHALVFASDVLFGQVFTLSFSPCADRAGAPGSEFRETFNCDVTTTQNDTSEGAQSWSISLTADGVALTSITTAGTVGDLAPVGLRSNGFEKSELALSGVGDCEGRMGAVSAVVLSFFQLITLPPQGSATLARVEAAGRFPQAGASAPARLFYADGCRGSGEPVLNVFSFLGNAVAPVLQPCDFQLLGQVLPGPTPSFALGFAACGGDVEGQPGGPFTRSFDCTLTTSQNSSGEGAQGWSISLSSDAVAITAITTEGTAGDLAPVGFRQGGFERSELTSTGVDGCARRRGAVSTVVLSFEQPVTLPPLGTQVLARIDVAGVFPEAGAVSQARLFYVDGCVRFVDGDAAGVALGGDGGGQKGGGEAVSNLIRHQDRSVVPTLGDCNFRLIGDEGLPDVCPSLLTCSVDQPSKLVVLDFSGAADAREQGLFRYHVFRDGQFIANLPSFRTTFVDQPPLGFATRDVAFAYRVVPVFANAQQPVFDVDPESGCQALQCVAVFSPADAPDVAFCDNFDRYQDDDELQRVGGWRIADTGAAVENASFTVSNPFGRANPPGLTGRRTTGPFLISDSRGAEGRNAAGSGASHDILSPGFDCSAMDTCWLHFDAGVQFDDDGTAVFDVDVSTDGGSTFANVFRRVAPARLMAPAVTTENAGGFFGRVDVDITAAAAGRSSVLIRFRHFEPTDDYWVAIDNVVVDDRPPPQATVPEDRFLAVQGPSGGLSMKVLDERFEAGIPLGNDVPEARRWRILSFELPARKTDDTWNSMDPADRHTGTVRPLGINRMQPRFTVCDSLFVGPEPNAELMITPVIDCSMFQEVFLVFDDEVLLSVRDRARRDQLSQHVLLSINGGRSFLESPQIPPPVFAYDLRALAEHGENSLFHKRGFFVKEAAGRANVAFGFRYEGPGETGWWGVDRVIVYGTVNEVVFRRGDANGDGLVNVSDVMNIMSYLFRGGSTTACLAAADMESRTDGCSEDNFNDIPRVRLSFCVYVLNFLFRGGPRPPDPFLECAQLRRCSDIRLGCSRSPPQCAPMPR